MYWADKVASLSTETEDVNILGQALVTTKQYHRAATIAMRNKLHTQVPRGQPRLDSLNSFPSFKFQALHMVNESEEAWSPRTQRSGQRCSGITRMCGSLS